MFLLLFMAVSLFSSNKIKFYKYSFVYRLRRDTIRDKGYRKDQYMRCKVKNSVSLLYKQKKRRNFFLFRIVLFVWMIFMKMKKSLYVHVNMHFINVVYHHGYNIIVLVLCVICALNRKHLVHVNYLIYFEIDKFN
jgi:hypothetical protein